MTKIQQSYDCLNCAWQSSNKPYKMRCPDCGSVVEHHKQNKPSLKDRPAPPVGVEEAAIKHIEADANDLDRYDKIFIEGSKFGSNWQQQKQAETISRLRGDMEWIAKFCNDPACKRLAKEALKENNI